MHNQETKQAIKQAYARFIQNNQTCCNGILTPQTISKIAQTIGYTNTQTSAFPEANLHLGCGNPTMFADIQEGDTVLDLGCGAGFDCFLAAEKVGMTGRVIGVDMTQEMIDKANTNTAKTGFKNVEFRLGEIENLPVPDESVDWVISNCVINLSTDKPKVFSEAYRVLRQGGKLQISDIAIVKPIPKDIAKSVQAYIGCISGAEMKDHYAELVEAAGFQNIQIIGSKRFNFQDILEDPSIQAAVQLFGFDIKEINIKSQILEDSIVSVKVAASKN